MKLFKLLVSIIISIVIFILASSILLAQGPDCTPYTEFFDFSLNDGGFINEGGTAFWNGSAWQLENASAIARRYDFSIQYTGDLTVTYYGASYDGSGNVFYGMLDNIGFQETSPDEGLYPITATILRSAEVITIEYLSFYNAGDRSGTNTITWVKIEGCAINPPEEFPYSCSTVEDYHFTGVITDAWQLSGSATISDSTLTLTPGDTAAQDLNLAGTTTYNAVFSVTQVVTEPVYLNVFLGTDVDILTITGTGYFTASLATPSLSVSEPISYVLENNSSEGELGIAYTCLYTSSQSVCVAGQNEWLLDIGNNYGTPIIGDVYGVSEGWTGVDYFDGSDTDAVEFNQIPFFIQDLDEELTLSGLIGGQLIAYSPNEVAVSYEYEIIPEVITVTGVYPAATDPTLEVWINDGTGWEIISQTASFSQTETFNVLIWSMEQGIASLTLSDPILQPVLLGLAMTGGGEDGVAFGFDEIEIWGCATGSAANVGECVFGDYELNANNGEPSPYYWLGNYMAQIEGATIGPDDVLYQNILPPTAGLYNLEIIADAVGAEGCSFDVRVYRTNSTQLLSSETVQCHVGIAQSYSVGLDLPSDAVEINIRGVQGQIFFDELCLTNPFDDSQCLNSNPLFIQGSYGYNGDFGVSGGKATLQSGGRVGAVGIDYNAAPGPYILNLTVSSDDADTWVTLGNNPGVYTTDENYEIVSLETITYPYYTALSGGYGPLVFNNGPEALEISQYCVLNATGEITQTTGFECDTLTNPDFDDGSTGWNSENTFVYGSVVSFGSSGIISQSLLSVSSTASVTIRLYASAYQNTEATLQLALTNVGGTDTFSDVISLSPVDSEGFLQTSFALTDTYTSGVLTILGDTGLEIDFICVIFSDEPPSLPEGEPPQSGEPPEMGDPGKCIMPPMALIPPVTSTTWFQSIWPWAAPGPDNFETVMVYNTSWVRYIGCRLNEMAEWLEEFGAKILRRLDIVILLLTVGLLFDILNTILEFLGGLGDIIGSVLGDLLGEALGELLGDLFGSALYILGLIGLFLLGLVGLLLLILAIIYLVWLIPQIFFENFQTAITSEAAAPLPLPTDPEDPLYGVIIGMQVFDQIAGGTYLYPIAILAIVIGSISILWWTIRRIGSYLRGGGE